jgi:hypothetical protein
MDLIAGKFPKTLARAVDLLMMDLSFRDKTKIANMSETDLIQFHTSYGNYIRTEFRLPGNDPLMQSCQSHAGFESMSGLQASFVILKSLQQRVRASNVLRVVK